MPVDALEGDSPSREGLGMSKRASASGVLRPRTLQTGPRLEGLARLPGAADSPEPRPGYVSRPHLVGRLIRAHATVTLIAAPAGYGKTTLATEWDGWDARPFAWVPVEREHDDRAGDFVATIEQSLDDVAPVEPPGRGASTRSRRGTAAAALARLVRSLDSRPPFVLVLDDLHVLRASASLEAVRMLARHMPPGSVLALCSRTEPAMPVGRLRANRALTEVRAHDLVMTAAEAVILLELCGLELATADAEELARKTEGWPAGLYLAALALRDQPDLHAAVARFGGDDAIVADYLREEVLSQLAPESLEFLTRAAPLDRLSGPLCDAVLERSDSARQLSELGGRDLLLVPLDRRQESYRCHGLLARMLRTELRRVQPGEEARLHRRASDWYGAQADVDRAMHHAVSAGDAARCRSARRQCPGVRHAGPHADDGGLARELHARRDRRAPRAVAGRGQRPSAEGRPRGGSGLGVVDSAGARRDPPD
jgi:LuxR family maltose regulon positive regulatory protein